MSDKPHVEFGLSPEELAEALDDIESQTKISLDEIPSRLRAYGKERPVSEIARQHEFELMAFYFRENVDRKPGRSGPQFLPRANLSAAGNPIEIPSPSSVTSEVIQYWKERARESKNPAMRARYAGLVWERTQTQGNLRDVVMAHLCIDSSIEVADRDSLKHETAVFDRLDHALSLAISLKDKSRSAAVAAAIQRYERLKGQDDLPGLWGRSFDLLLSNPGVLAPDEEDKIVASMEKRFGRLLEREEPWLCERAGARLADFYSKRERIEDVSRVIRAVGLKYETASSTADPLRATNWLEHAHKLYRQYKMTTEVARVGSRIHSLAPAVLADMKAITHEVEIPRAEFDKYINAHIQRESDATLTVIAMRHIPRVGDIREQLLDHSKKYPIQFLFNRQLTDHRGRCVAKLKPLAEDLDGYLVHELSQNMYFSQIFLRAVLAAAVERHGMTADSLAEHLFKSPVFPQEIRGMVTLGIGHFLTQDHLSSVHILIPAIEACVRSLVYEVGGDILKPNRYEGFNVRTLDDLLRSNEVMESVGEDATHYLRTTLTDTRGWNLRNSICHGLLPSDRISSIQSDRVIHILLVLGQLRLAKVTESQST